MKKKTSLKDFSAKGATPYKPDETAQVEISTAATSAKTTQLGKARPGKANLPTITFRVSQEKWERLKILCIQERTTIQALAETAFEAEFKRRGLPW